MERWLHYSAETARSQCYLGPGRLSTHWYRHCSVTSVLYIRMYVHIAVHILPCRLFCADGRLWLPGGHSICIQRAPHWLHTWAYFSRHSGHLLRRGCHHCLSVTVGYSCVLQCIHTHVGVEVIVSIQAFHQIQKKWLLQFATCIDCSWIINSCQFVYITLLLFVYKHIRMYI